MGIVVVLLAILVAIAIGVGAYNAGLHQAVQTVTEEGGRTGEVVRVIGPGYGYGYRHGFFPFGFLLFPLFFIGLFFLLGRLFWRGRWGDHPHPHWGPGPYGKGPSAFEDWHRRQHEEGGDRSGTEPESA
jgi:hypothetical protein